MNANRKHLSAMSLAALALAASAGLARADAIMGAPVFAPPGLSTATIEFRGSSAGYTGELYFLGWGSEDDILHHAENTRHNNLGQWLFNNHSSAVGAQAVLDGMFDSGAVLHFAYEIIHPRNRRDLFRTDREADANNFAWDSATGSFAVEDLRRDYKHYDGDFNDAIFTINFQRVPAPGSLALLSLSGIVLARRRKR